MLAAPKRLCDKHIPPHFSSQHLSLHVLTLQLDDEPSKLATHYSPGQREFFKHVVSSMNGMAHGCHSRQPAIYIPPRSSVLAAHYMEEPFNACVARLPSVFQPHLASFCTSAPDLILWDPFETGAVRHFVVFCYAQLETIAADVTAENGVGSAPGIQLLNMDLGR